MLIFFRFLWYRSLKNSRVEWFYLMDETVCKNLGQLQVNRLLVLLVLIYYLFHPRFSKTTLLWSLGVPSLQIKIIVNWSIQVTLPRPATNVELFTGGTVVNRVEWLWSPSDSFVTCFWGPDGAQRPIEFLSFWSCWPIKTSDSFIPS